ncbi:MAG: flagellar motor switch protein FliG [Gammaproteobacteria bacterium]|nr:flagellar motor switch protein FliG [Gammaproteobacteria bacterium]
MADKAELPDLDGNDALQAELEALSTTQRAAVLMLLLGEDQAASIIRYMDPKEVQALGAAMVSVGDISQEAVNAVLDDFIATFKKQTSLGLGTSDYVESVLRAALGEDKAASVLGRINPTSASKGLEILRWMDARAIAEMVQGEHPQVVAIILSVLENAVAADVLSFLPQEARPEIVERVARLETVQPAAMEELEAIMRKQFASRSSSASSSFGGVKAAAKIMNLTKVDMESMIMKGVESLDADLAQAIQDNMLTFADLGSVDNRAVQTLLRNIEPDLLMVALKGADEIVRDKFMSNMSERARAVFLDDMEAKGPMRLSDVEDAQKKIMRQARKLSEAGELMLAAGDDFV